MPIKRDQADNPIPISAIDSGEKESFLSNRGALPHAGVPLDGVPSGEIWMALCGRAAVEQDPKKLLELVSEINRLLDARRKRLTHESDAKASR